MRKGGIFGSALAAVALSLAANMPMLDSGYGPFSGKGYAPSTRTRWPGRRKPAGSKLARQARKGRVGITTIH